MKVIFRQASTFSVWISGHGEQQCFAPRERQEEMRQTNAKTRKNEKWRTLGGERVMRRGQESAILRKLAPVPYPVAITVGWFLFFFFLCRFLSPSLFLSLSLSDRFSSAPVAREAENEFVPEFVSRRGQE